MNIISFLVSSAHAASATGTVIPGINIYISLGYALAGVVAAVLRILILSKQPAQPWPERIRQALMSFVIVSCLSPLMGSAGVPTDWALIVGLTFAAAGPEKSLRFLLDVFNKILRTVINHSDIDQSYKDRLKDQDQADEFEREKNRQDH